MKKLLLFSFVAILSSSCYVSHFTVGDGPIKDKGRQETYDQGKNVWLFWGLVGLNDASPSRPEDDYTLKTKTTFGDALITGITAGIVTTKTVRIKVRKETE